MRSAYIYNFLIEANIMASIAILLMIPLRRFLRKQLGNSALCFGWLLIAIRLLLPISLVNPLIHEIRSPFAADAAIRPIAGQIKVRVTDAVDSLSTYFWMAENRPAYEAVDRLYEDIFNANASHALAKIWGLGVLLITLWYVISNVHFRLRLRSDRIEPISGDLLREYEAICAQRGVHPVPVYFTDPLPSACLVGVFRPYIALPLSASPQDAIQVLTHEICHLRNRDHLWGVLRLFGCAIHWFNPLVWAAASMSRTDCELRCDDRVTQGMNTQDRKSYANVLVLAASRRNAPGLGILATGMTMTGKRLKTRILSVIEDHRPVRALTIAFVLLSSMCLLGAFATSETKEQLEMGVSMFQERYMTEGLQGTQQIRNKDEAIAYAQSIGNQIRLQDDKGVFSAFQHDGGRWLVTLTDADQNLLFYMDFLSNGVILDLEKTIENENWMTEGTHIGHMFISSDETESLRSWGNQTLEQLNPGSSDLINEFLVQYMLDAGDTQYISLYSDPKDSHYDMGVTLLCRTTEDGYELLRMSFIGNG